ncbi:MAG TPA: histidine phosphatase family protein [Fimbriimonas sp.]
MRLFLVRHGQTEWNVAGRAQGHTDIPLDAVGVEQARRLGRAFEGASLDRLLSSDLLRCRQTVEPVSRATGSAVEESPDLRERSFGEWEGLDFRDVAERIAESALEQGISRQAVRPPGGESFRDVWNRLDRVLTEIHHQDGTMMVATHGGTASILLARLVLGSLDTSRSFRFANTAVCELERRADGLYNLVRYNDASHLSEHSLTGSLDGVAR